MKLLVYPRPYTLVEGERRPIKGVSTWTYEIQVPRAGGKRRSISKGGFTSKRDAERAGALKKAEYHHDPTREAVKPSSMALSDFIEQEWLPVLRLKPSTVQSYRDLAAAYVKPHIGDERLDRLTPGRIGGLYTILRERGSRTGKPLSENTVHHVHVLLGKVLRYAIESEALQSNPLDRLPRDGKPTAQAPDPDKLKHWTREEASTFLDATATDRLAALWRFAVDTGMRRGELSGLRWSDIDLEAATVTVRRNRVIVGKTVAEGTPKTKTGQRSVDLAPSTVVALRAHRKQQLEDRVSWGPAWAGTDEVFTREDGTPLHPQTIGWQLKKASKAAKLPLIGVHGLRHTCATLGLAAGVPVKVMSERLGHSSTTVTADLYQHVVPGMQADAARSIMGEL